MFSKAVRTSAATIAVISILLVFAAAMSGALGEPIRQTVGWGLLALLGICLATWINSL